MNTTPELDLVRITRTNDLEELVCRIYRSTTDHIVASELSESLDLDGLCLIPTRTVVCFDRSFKRSDFYRVAVDAWPQASQQVELLRHLTGDISSDLALLATRQATVAVHMEINDPDIAYVGTLTMKSSTEVLVNRISSKGRLIAEPLHVDVSAITKLEVATRYLTAIGYAARKLSTG